VSSGLWWIGIAFVACGVWRLARCILPVVANTQEAHRVDF
jgi:hypothetical protein